MIYNQVAIGILSVYLLCSCNNESTTPNVQVQPPAEAAKQEQVQPDTSSRQKEITIASIYNKKETLQKLVGVHTLESVSGSSGANSLIDFYKENGKWVTSASANSGGQREAYDMDITKEDMAKLKSMKLVVNSDLSIDVICNNKTFFQVPFQENGMTYLLKRRPSDFITRIPKELNQKTTFIGDELYLYAKDNCSESEVNYLNVAQVMVDAVCITYHVQSDSFFMELFYADCCDGSTYTFK